MSKADQHWMTLALEQALKAGAAGEVPVGAVLVRDGELLAAGGNGPVGASDPTAHAEIVVLRKAAAAEGNYRLPGSVLYVTIEPCCMCAGALVHARVAEVVYGAAEPRAGALDSQMQVYRNGSFNHHPDWRGGVLADECAALMRDFFAARR